ncbi:hypothetical protein CapIbe_015107 [Capra ibex]
MPGLCSEDFVQGRDAGDLQEPTLCGILYAPKAMGFPNFSVSFHQDISYTPVVKKLQLKTNSDRGEVFQSWILGRPERNEMDRFYLRVIQENIYNFQSKQKDEEENYKGILITYNENLTGRFPRPPPPFHEQLPTSGSGEPAVQLSQEHGNCEDSWMKEPRRGKNRSQAWLFLRHS